LTFQLTPLLDLLLIVIFAQYLEVRETAAQARTHIRRQADDELGQLRALSDRERARAERLAESRRELERQAIAREQELAAQLEHALRRQERFGDAVAELFQVPDELVRQALGERAADGQQSPEELLRLHEEFRELARQRGRQVLRHFLTYEEMQKRCDIWEIYITDSGQIDLDAAGRTFQFRAATPDAFAAELYERYKTLPDVKRMVIILFSYGNAQAVIRRAAQEGLPRATARMQADAIGQTRFEYADLGFHPRTTNVPSPPP
jgi:hypothetical protein